MQDLLDQLSQIFESLGKEDVAPPITNEELQRLTAELPFALPKNLEKLYRRHDGVKEMIPVYDFLSLSEAITEYEYLIAFGEDEQDETFFNKMHLPIFQFEGAYFLVDCSPDNEQAIYEFSFESEIVKKYESLDQMLQIIVDAYLSRAYYTEDEMLLEDTVLLQKIENKYSSQDGRNEKEAQWNQLCAEIDELKRIDILSEPSAEELQLQALSAAFGLAAPEELRKESLIRRLYETHDERAINLLVEFLSDENPKIIAVAAFGLGELKAREKLPELIQLTKHSAEVVRNLATHAIASIASPGDQLLLEPILDRLSDEAVLVRIAAIEALGQLRNSIAVEPLIALLENENSGVKFSSIQALGKIGDTSAIEALQQRRSRILPQEAEMEANTLDEAIHLIEKANSLG
jgi:HEAT repeats/SMI1 / KNR4 family (SUKH-1)